jgi:predicted nucleic acid-binding protein
MITLDVAVLDAGALMAWLALGGVASNRPIHLAAGAVCDAVLSEVVPFLMLRWEGNDERLRGDLLALELAPVTWYPSLSLAFDAIKLPGELSYATATSVVLAQRQELPLLTFSDPGVRTVTVVRLSR